MPPLMHCWADLQSVHGFRCYDNIVPNAKCQRVLALAYVWLDQSTFKLLANILKKQFPVVLLSSNNNKHKNVSKLLLYNFSSWANSAYTSLTETTSHAPTDRPR